MRYQGGKTIIAPAISQKILKIMNEKNIKPDILVSLFCGACSVETRLADHFDKVICNDSHKYLIALLKAVQEGYQLPEYISEQQYKYIRDNKDWDKVLTGFAGFGCSFGGKFFGGYARNRTNRNYAMESKKSLMRDKKHWNNIDFICRDYKDVKLPDRCVIYADPPYNNTTGYKTRFNSDEFWDYAREISKNHLMFISEQNAPKDFMSIWERKKTRTIDNNKRNQPVIKENLFVHKAHFIYEVN